MSPTAAVSDVRIPAEVFGVHGAAGVSYWKCLSRRLGLSAGWEAVEWACLPPGGVSGEHVHTRTEELYFILAGTGRITWVGDARLVRCGDLIATPLGARHGLANTGPDPLAWLVMEVSAPAQSAALAGRPLAHEPRKETPVSLHVVDLRTAGRFDPGTVLDGPIRDVRLLRLSPTERVVAGRLALRPAGTSLIVRNASPDMPLRLLLVSVLPRVVTDGLPGRSPVADPELRP